MNYPNLKIGIVAPLPPPYGGIANWTESIIESLNERNIEYCILNTAITKRQTEGRSIFDRVVKSGFRMLKIRHQLKHLLVSKKINIVHIATSGSLAAIRDILLLKLCKKFQIPCIYHLHFGTIPQSIHTNKISWHLIKKAMEFADTILVLDHKTYEALHNADYKLNVQVMPNYINTQNLPHAESFPQKQVVFLGWCIKTKGIEELFRAWNLLKNVDGWQLKIIGPYDKKYIKSILGELSTKDITIVGELKHEEAMRVLNESSVFVLPSYTEGFPMSVLEAMACGKAIIATDVGAIKSMLQNECGIVIEPQNVGSLANAIDTVIGDASLMNKLGENAKKRVFHYYSEDKVMNSYIQCWANVLDQ